jgi:hypothetical protein
MPTKSVTPGRWAVGAALLLVTALTAPVAVALAAGPEIDLYAMQQVVAQQVPTPTPFRFLTPTPLPRTTTTTTTQPMPRAGGFPIELALPALAGGLAAIGGGSFLLRRKPSS